MLRGRSCYFFWKGGEVGCEPGRAKGAETRGRGDGRTRRGRRGLWRGERRIRRERWCRPIWEGKGRGVSFRYRDSRDRAGTHSREEVEVPPFRVVQRSVVFVISYNCMEVIRIVSNPSLIAAHRPCPKLVRERALAKGVGKAGTNVCRDGTGHRSMTRPQVLLKRFQSSPACRVLSLPIEG